jgi:hypothetical protein
MSPIWFFVHYRCRFACEPATFKHLLRRAEDRATLERLGCRRFVEHYLAAADLSTAARAALLQKLRRHLPALTGE